MLATHEQHNSLAPTISSQDAVYRALLQCAQRGDTSFLREILSTQCTAGTSTYIAPLDGVHVNNPSSSSSSSSRNVLLLKALDAALVCAARGGHTDFVRIIVKEGSAHVDARNEVGRNALHHASAQGHIDTVRCLVSELGADICARDTYCHNATALHIAAEKGHIGVMGVLLDKRWSQLDVNVKRAEGLTPLLVAVEADQLEAVEWLVGREGIDICAAGADGVTCLHRAAEFSGGVDGQKNGLKIMKCLLRSGGIDTECRTDEGITPLHFASSLEGSPEAVRLLLDHGAEVNAVDACGNTPLNCVELSDEIRHCLIEAGGTETPCNQLLLDDNWSTQRQESEGSGRRGGGRYQRGGFCDAGRPSVFMF